MANNSPSHRQQKAASIIHQAIIETFRKGRMLDPDLLSNPLIITNIRVTPDLKKAYCYFVPFNTNLTLQEISQALKNSKHAIRNSVTNIINLKYSPEITFEFDHAYENVKRIDELIEQSKKSVIT